MSVGKRALKPVSPQIAAWARKQKKNPIIAFCDAVDGLIDWSDFAEMYSHLGQPGIHPRTLAIVTLLQHANGLSDRQAIECLDTRLDWKYAARMGLDDAAFDHTVLSEFRQRLIDSGLKDVLLNKLLEAAERNGLLKTGKQRTDSTHILANVRELGRLERVHEAMRVTLNVLISHHCDAYMVFHNPVWIERYDRAPYHFKAPKEGKARDKFTNDLGCDVNALLENALKEPDLASIDAVKTLALIFEQQFIFKESSWRLRDEDESTSNSDRIASPHDADARFGKKGSHGWLGYKVHYTETCTPTAPRLITNVAATAACVDDSKALMRIQQSLIGRGLRPDLHLVDGGYADLTLMHDSEHKFGIKLLAPLKPSTSWQSREGQGFALSDFDLDPSAQTATCPAGKRSVSWSVRRDGGTSIAFADEDCGACPVVEKCTKSTRGRRITMRRPDLARYQREKRDFQKTDQFQKQYRMRSGIEGTHSQAVRTAGFRKTNYIGLEKTELKGWLVAAGLNLLRIGTWLISGTTAATRTNLMQKVAATA